MDKRFQSTLLEGDFAPGVRLGGGLVEGDFWPRRAGCGLLYRGLDSIAAIDLDHPVGVITGPGPVVLPGWLAHPAGREVWYLLRWVSASGRQENNTVALLGVRRDSDGIVRPLTRRWV